MFEFWTMCTAVAVLLVALVFYAVLIRSSQISRWEEEREAVRRGAGERE